MRWIGWRISDVQQEKKGQKRKNMIWCKDSTLEIQKGRKEMRKGGKKKANCGSFHLSHRKLSLGWSRFSIWFQLQTASLHRMVRVWLGPAAVMLCHFSWNECTLKMARQTSLSLNEECKISCFSVWRLYLSTNLFLFCGEKQLDF